MPRASFSSGNSAPAATATAGLRYVITPARVGPTSLISSRKATNAIAVQTTSRRARAARTFSDGMVAGLARKAAGAWTTRRA
nr:hypothetical protein [Streptomyces sp. AK010]